MSDLCERLQDVSEAGVYELNCPIEVLFGNVALSGLQLFEVDLSGRHNKGEFLAAIAKAIQAPDWFGHNLDALNDALCDLSWLEPGTSGYVLLLQGCRERLGLSESEYSAVRDIFNEATEYWRSQHKPFWVFLADAV